MKRGRTAGIFILLMAVLGFFLVSHAADKKKNQTKSLTIKTLTPSKTKVKGKKPLKFKPDLVVEDISLDKGFITFTLKNNGPGFLSDDDHKQGEVKVSYKGRVSKYTYPFSKVDPKRKLKKPDGSVTYETKEKLTSRQEVTVSVYFGKKTLKPDKKISLKRTLGKKQPTLVQKPEMVPKHRDDGIRVFRPQEGDVLHRGGSISINYRFSWDEVAAGGDIVFSLRLDENRDEVVSTSVENAHPNLPPGAFHEVVLEVPRDVSHGEYHILASHSDSGAEGESDVFSIQGFGEGGPGHPTAWEIRVVFPSYLGVNWPRGSIKTITWRIAGEYPSERAFLVTLMRGAESVRTIRAGGAVWKGIFETYSLKWVMPTDIPLASDYRIEVVDRNGPTEGISEREFSVTRPICGIEVGLEDLEVHSLDPSSGFLYRVGQPLNFRISSSGLVEVTAQLVPVEEHLRHWSIPLRDYGGSFTTASFSWTPPPEIPVGDYRIYVTAVIPGCATGTGHAYSEVFHLYAPIPDPEYEINVTAPRDGQIVTFAPSSSLFFRIDWSGGFPDGTRFTKILYKGSVELQRIGPDVHSPGYYYTNFNVVGYASGSDYHVRVEAWSLEGTELLASDNTENFTLLNMSYECSAYQPLVIFSPNNYASEVRVIDRPLSIEWCHYPDASPDQRIRLLLVRDIAFGGGEWEINSSIPSSPSQTTWVIPTSVPPGDGYRVRAEQIGGTGVATSVRTFNISNP